MSFNLTGDPSTHWLQMLSMKPKEILLSDIREELKMEPRKVSSWGYSPYGAKAGFAPACCN